MTRAVRLDGLEMVVNDDLSLVQTAMIRFDDSAEPTGQQRLLG